MKSSAVAAKIALMLACAAAGVCRPAWGGALRATQEKDGTIRVVAAGRFETTFTRRKGFVATWYDLKHDPDKKRDLAPVADENGILWTKTRGAEQAGDGSWYANPPDKLALLEAGPARVRVRTGGVHRKYGRTQPQHAWKDLGFEQTFTIYPTGDVYIDYALIAAKPVRLHHFLLIVKSTGAWGKNGRGPDAGEVHCAGQHGPKRPSRWSKTKTPFALQWSNGPTHFQDILMVLHKGVYNGSYWNEGYKDRDLRTGLDLLGRWPDKTVPAGKDHILLLMRFDHDINGEKAAAAFAEDYRSPDRPAVSKGELDKADPGDRDADGFNEAEGCYVLKAADGEAAFTLHGAKLPRMDPAFKVKGWPGAAPATVEMGGKRLTRGKEFVASARAGVLIVQILEPVRKDVRIAISPAAGSK